MPEPFDPEILLSGQKLTRTGTDGTTVMFYRFGTGGKQANGLSAPQYQAPDAAIRQYVAEAYQEAEKLANIRCFNFDALTEDDQRYLRKHHVVLPKDPDVVVQAWMDYRSTVGTVSGYPRASDKNPPNDLLLNLNYRFMPLAEQEQYEALRTTVLHEVGHSLGLRHSFQDETCQLEEKDDCAQNTLMSYNNNSRYSTGEWARRFTAFYPQHYSELDMRALQAMYGAPPAVSTELAAARQREDKEQKACAFPADVEAKIPDIFDGLSAYFDARQVKDDKAGAVTQERVFTPQDFQRLQQEVETYLQTHFAEPVAIIRNYYPKFGTLGKRDSAITGEDFVVPNIRDSGIAYPVGNFEGFDVQEARPDTPKTPLPTSSQQKQGAGRGK